MQLVLEPYSVLSPSWHNSLWPPPALVCPLGCPTAPTSACHGAALGSSLSQGACRQCLPKLNPIPRTDHLPLEHSWGVPQWSLCSLLGRYWVLKGCLAQHGFMPAGASAAVPGRRVAMASIMSFRCGCWSWKTSCRRSGRSWESCARSIMSWQEWQRAGRTVSASQAWSSQEAALGRSRAGWGSPAHSPGEEQAGISLQQVQLVPGCSWHMGTKPRRS